MRQMVRSAINRVLAVLPSDRQYTYLRYINILGHIFHVDQFIPDYEYGFFHEYLINLIINKFDFDQSEIDFLLQFQSWTETFLYPSISLSDIASHLGLSEVFNEYLNNIFIILWEHLDHSICDCKQFGFFHDQAIKRMQLTSNVPSFIQGLKGQFEVIVRHSTSMNRKFI